MATSGTTTTAGEGGVSAADATNATAEAANELFPWIDRFETAPERLVVTLGSLVALVALLFAVRWTAGRLGERYDTQWGEVGAGVVSMGLALGAGTLLVWVWDVTPTVEAAILSVGNPYEIAARAVVTVALFVGLYVLTGVVRRAVDELAESRRGVSRHESEIVYRLAQVTIYVFGAIVALGTWEVDLSGFLVGAGFLGIVLGMAARQTLGALLAGFVLMFSRPFEIGDWVKVGDKEGIVTDITVVNTRLQTFDGEYVMLPNDVVSSNDIVNRTRKGRLRLHVEVGVDYEADVERASEIASDAMGELDEVLSVPRPRVVLKEFGDSAVTLGLRFWIDKPSARRKWRARTAVIAAVKEAFEEEGVKIPFPQRELSERPGEGDINVPPGAAAPGAPVETDGEEPEGDEDSDDGEGGSEEAEGTAEADDD
jgi:small-conductance mechanosensitive channel